MGYRHILLFLILLLSVLLIENRAAASVAGSSETSGEVLAAGSLIEIRDDLDYGLAREKRFCDGQEVGFLRSLMSENCCTIRVNPLLVPELKQVVINKGLLRVSEPTAELSSDPHTIKLAANLDLYVRCGNSAMTDRVLKNALGNLLLIQEVKSGPRLVTTPAVVPALPSSLPPSTVQKTEDAPAVQEKENSAAVPNLSLNEAPDKDVHSETSVITSAK